MDAEQQLIQRLLHDMERHASDEMKRVRALRRHLNRLEEHVFQLEEAVRQHEMQEALDRERLAGALPALLAPVLGLSAGGAALTPPHVPLAQPLNPLLSQQMDRNGALADTRRVLSWQSVSDKEARRAQLAASVKRAQGVIEAMASLPATATADASLAQKQEKTQPQQPQPQPQPQPQRKAYNDQAEYVRNTHQRLRRRLDWLALQCGAETLDAQCWTHRLVADLQYELLSDRPARMVSGAQMAPQSQPHPKPQPQPQPPSQPQQQ